MSGGPVSGGGSGGGGPVGGGGSGGPVGGGDEVALVVDATGLRCPMPVITLAQRFAEVPVGAVVELLADDPAAAHDVPAWCRLREQEYVGGRPRDDGAPGSAYRVRRLH